MAMDAGPAMGAGGLGGQGEGGAGARAGTGVAGGGGGGGTGGVVVPLGGSATTGWSIVLSTNEVATRLARFLWDSAPDDALLRYVAAANPQTNVDVGAIADAMLIDARSESVVRRFYDWWLSLDRLANLEKPANPASWFSPAAAAAMRKQVHDFASTITWAPDASFARLLTESVVVVPTELTPAYPASASPAGQPRQLDPVVYSGILTLPAPMAIFAKSSREAPTLRGRLVRDRLLCDAVPPPPPSVDVPLGAPDATRITVRQRLETAVASAGCRGCHMWTDPVGYAFNHFDGAGAFRANDVDGEPVDATGHLEPAGSGSPKGPLDGAPSLMKLLVGSEEVERCFSAHWVSFALGPQGTSAGELLQDDSSSYVQRRAQIRGRLDLRGMLRAVAETRPFLAQ